MNTTKQTKWQYQVGDYIMTRTLDGCESLKVLQRAILYGQRAYKMEYGYTVYEQEQSQILLNTQSHGS